ncbi:MAG: radical SAM protein [Candidatus Lokiarchaeota archaeon]|nr:radical SAM protein [Candidatus Lokiarchaeota archaeon]
MPRYEGAIYRPPSEADSLILQIEIGCSNIDCTFCVSYKDKKLRIRSLDEIKQDIRDTKPYADRVRKVFLADGDALVIRTEKLLKILELLKRSYPNLERVGIYATALNVLKKTEEQLMKLKDAGLGIIYLGIETGDDVILKRVKKNMTSDQMVKACKKVLKIGFELSVTIILGLGGKDRWRENAIETARVINEIDAPTYVGALTLMIPRGTPLYQEYISGEFEPLSNLEILKEMRLLIENINITNKCIFRSNHASNYLPIGGDLPDDKEEILNIIDRTLEQPQGKLRPEFLRGL